MTTMSYITEARPCLENLAARLPASRFALILTVSPDAPVFLTVVPRDNPGRPLDVAVVDTVDGTYYVAYTEGGSLRLDDVTYPAIAAEAIEWTLTGR